MSIFSRILTMLVVASLVVGPVSAATTPGTSLQVAQATSSTSGAISGVVTDESGAPVAGASITLHGAKTVDTKSDSKGAFQIDDIPAGLYVITAQKPGYQMATESDYAVFAGEVAKLAVTLQSATFTSLRTIASVRTVGRGTFNTSTASISSVSARDFENQGTPQVTRVLDQIPGVQISLPNNSGNGAVPGAITFPNIRNGLSFETASLIDGHPLSVGRFGDYVTTFLNSFMFQDAEIIKGPGAMAPQTNYAIGGTVNLRTKDPTLTETPSYTFGVTNFGGTYFNFGISDTIANGKLGFVADVAGINDPSALNGTPVYYSNNSGVIQANGTTDVIGYNDSRSPIPGTNSYAFNNYQMAVCCYSVHGQYDNLSELLKVRYKFSSATTATVSYLGSQSTADQNGNTSQLTPAIFQPTAGYSGPLATGTRILASNIYPGGDIETNNEPILQAEVSTTLGGDTLLARYYHASIDRLLTEGTSNVNQPVVLNATLNGVNAGSGTAYNNVTVPIAWYNYFRQNEIDALAGVDFQYVHPYGAGDSLTASVSQTNSQTTYYTQGTNALTAGPGNTFVGPATLGNPTVSIPTGSNEVFTTLLLRDNTNFGDKLSTVVSLYQNLYRFTAAQACGSPCSPSGSNATFTTITPSHFDERLGLTYRPNQDLILRAAAGSAIAPPYINLLSKFSTTPTYTAGAQQLFVGQNNPNLVPETAFGWDLGADYRLKKSYYLSGDIYLTNLFNQFITTTLDSGKTCTSVSYPGSGCPVPGGPVPPPEVYYNINGNVNNARYEGIEVSFKHVVQDGVGFVLAGSTQRGYAYNLGSSFYCSNLTGAACNPATYNQNLAVIGNVNFNGGAPSSTYLGSTTACPASNFYCLNGSNVSNQSVPYLQGNAELNWQTSKGWYAALGATLFGKNNSYNEPPFTEFRATLRAPLNHELSFQISGNNIFNAYRQLFPIVGGGVPLGLANGMTAATNGNVLGPAQWNFVLTKTFGDFGGDGRDKNSSL